MLGQNIELQHNLESFISVLAMLSAKSSVLLFGLFRELEQIQLELTKANEKAVELQKNVEQTTQRAEQSQQETLKIHQTELKNMQDQLTDMVRRTLKSTCQLCAERSTTAALIVLQLFYLLSEKASGD